MTVASPGIGEAVKAWAEKSPKGLMATLARNDCEYFLNTFCWGRNYQKGIDFEFTERPKQKEFRELILAEKLVVALKAREVGWTWELALVALWEAWRYTPYQCLYFCQREDNAKEFIQRVRFAHAKLPEWLGYPPEEKPTTNSRFVVNFGGGRTSEIISFPSVPTAMESWHPRRVIADQWGLINEKVLPSALGAIGLDGYFVGLDTSQGMNNEFFDVYTSCRDGDPGFYAPEGRRFHHIFASWRDNPDFHVRPSGGTQRDTERMYPENDQEAFAMVAAGTPVYPEFRAHLHVAKEPLRAIVGLPIFTACDWGNTPAAVCFQVAPSGQCRILAEFQELEPGVNRFARILLDQFAQRWPGFEFIWWGDPSGRSRRDTDGKTCFGILKDEFGIRVNAGAMQWTKRRESVAARLTRLVDGEVGMLIDPSCQLLIQGFLGQYHFPDATDAQAYANFEKMRNRRNEVTYS